MQAGKSVVSNTSVATAFSSMPAEHQTVALDLRSLILDTARDLEHTGGVEETLKWGQPSYLPKKSRIGTAVRIGQHDDSSVALYVNCQTTLIESYRTLLGEDLSFAGNRAVVLPVSEALPTSALQLCIRMALYYHLDKRLSHASRHSA